MDFHTNTTGGNRCANGIGFWIDRTEQHTRNEMHNGIRGDFYSMDKHWNITITLETLVDKIQHTMSYDMVAKTKTQAENRARALASKRYKEVSLKVEEKTKEIERA